MTTVTIIACVASFLAGCAAMMVWGALWMSHEDQWMQRDREFPASDGKCSFTKTTLGDNRSSSACAEDAGKLSKP